MEPRLPTRGEHSLSSLGRGPAQSDGPGHMAAAGGEQTPPDLPAADGVVARTGWSTDTGCAAIVTVSGAGATALVGGDLRTAHGDQRRLSLVDRVGRRTMGRQKQL